MAPLSIERLERIDSVLVEALAPDPAVPARLAIWLIAWLGGQLGWKPQGKPQRRPADDSVAHAGRSIHGSARRALRSHHHPRRADRLPGCPSDRGGNDQDRAACRGRTLGRDRSTGPAVARLAGCPRRDRDVQYLPLAPWGRCSRAGTRTPDCGRTRIFAHRRPVPESRPNCSLAPGTRRTLIHPLFAAPPRGSVSVSVRMGMVVVMTMGRVMLLGSITICGGNRL